LVKDKQFFIHITSDIRKVPSAFFDKKHLLAHLPHLAGPMGIYCPPGLKPLIVQQ
jgi:hypothetical protein